MRHWCSVPVRVFGISVAGMWICAGDGTAGWPDGGEFDVILVSAAGAEIPAALAMQLAPSGRLIIPLGNPDGVQRLTKLVRAPDGRFAEEEIEEVRFVPLVSR